MHCLCTFYLSVEWSGCGRIQSENEMAERFTLNVSICKLQTERV